MAGFPFVNPQSIALLNRASYLTVSQFKDAPTALDLSNLVPDGTQLDNDVAIAELLGRASSAIDSYVYPDGTGGTLAASIDTDETSVRPQDGYLPLICRFKPVIMITALSAGPTPSQLQPLGDQSVADIEVGESMRVIYVPVAGLSAGNVFGGLATGRRGRVRVRWSYVSGYPHGLLAADVAADATTIELTSTLGMQTGTPLDIYDGGKTETVTVAEVVSPTEISLVAGCKYSHAVPEAPDAVAVSALPGSILQASILAASSFVKERGDNAFVLPDSPSALAQIAKGGGGGADDAARCMALLQPFQIVAPRAQ